jgi:hypothetical protein
MSAAEDRKGYGLEDDGPFRDGKVHVCADLCSTCVFRKGNLMQLASGRVRQMVDESVKNDSAITCHKTLGKQGERAICRGFYDRHKDNVVPLRLAQHLDLIVEDKPE